MKRSSLALGKVFSLSIIALLAGCSSFIGTFAALPKMMGGELTGVDSSVYVPNGLCDAVSDHSVNGNGAGIHDRTGLRFCQKCERGSYNSVSVYHCGDIYRIEPHAQSGKGDPAIPVSDPGIQQCAVHERHFFPLVISRWKFLLTVIVNLYVAGVLVFGLTRAFQSEKVMFG